MAPLLGSLSQDMVWVGITLLYDEHKPLWNIWEHFCIEGINIVASFPGTCKIGGSTWNTLFAHDRLPRFFWGTWKLLYMSLCCTIIYHWIIRVVTRNGGALWDRSCNSTKPYCTPLVRLVKALSLQFQQTYTGSHSFFVTATRNIPPRRLGRSSSSPWMVNSPLACLDLLRKGRNGTAKLSPLHVTMQLCSACASCIFTKYLSVLLSASSAYMSW